MQLHLRPALEADLAFCESLSRTNMASYHAARGIGWDPARYLASWARFENQIVLADDRPVGLLQLLVVDDALEIRDLQLLPAHQGLGIGTWAVAQVQSIAAGRGLAAVRLRVYAENPAMHLYQRLGFTTESIDDGVIHMSYRLPPDGRGDTRQFPGQT